VAASSAIKAPKASSSALKKPKPEPGVRREEGVKKKRRYRPGQLALKVGCARTHNRPCC
jgi:hypothetical protein